MDPCYIQQRYVTLAATMEPELYDSIVKNGSLSFSWLAPTYTRADAYTRIYNTQKRIQCEAAVYVFMYMMKVATRIHMEHVSILGGLHTSGSDDRQHLTLVWENNGKEFMVVHLPYDEDAEYFKIYEARMFLAGRRRRGGISFAEFIHIDFD